MQFSIPHNWIIPDIEVGMVWIVIMAIAWENLINKLKGRILRLIRIDNLWKWKMIEFWVISNYLPASYHRLLTTGVLSSRSEFFSDERAKQDSRKRSREPRGPTPEESCHKKQPFPSLELHRERKPKEYHSCTLRRILLRENHEVQDQPFHLLRPGG